MISSYSGMLSFTHPEKNFVENNLLDAEDWNDNNFIVEKGHESPTSLSSSSETHEMNFEINNDDLIYDSVQHESLDTFINSSKLFCEKDFLSQAKGGLSMETTFVPEQVDSLSLSNNNSIFNATANLSLKKDAISPSEASVPSSLISSYVEKVAVPSLSKPSINQIPIPPVGTRIFSLETVTPSSTKFKPIMKKKDPDKIPIPKSGTVPLSSIITSAVAPTILNLNNPHIYVTNAETDERQRNAKKSGRGPKKNDVKQVYMTASKVNEIKKIKREQQLARNRESASLSRQRKKEHVNMLETRVAELLKINNQLMEENSLLKHKIGALETENCNLRNTLVNSASSKTTGIIFVILFTFVVNFSSLSRIATLPVEPIDHKIDPLLSRKDFSNKLVFHSRSLLHFESNIKNNTFKKDKIFDTLSQKSFNSNVMNDLEHVSRLGSKKFFGYRKGLMNHESVGDCGENLNETYIKKINNALNGLVKEMKKETKFKSKAPKNKKLSKSKTLEPVISANSSLTKVTKGKAKGNNCTRRKYRLRSAIFSKNIRIERIRKNLSVDQGELFNLTSQQIGSIIRKSINRKADTFYVVTSPNDFLTIIPSTNNSSIKRPKVSFMIPIFHPQNHPNSNGTFQNQGEYSLLKIDCKVLDTSIVQLDQRVFRKGYVAGLGNF